MCKYQISKPNKPLMCEYTKSLCTLCVMGDMSTLRRAERAEKEKTKNAK